ncbi:hypothetical protein PL11201_720004 [Planktothrix sp. PCC 11201]|nr:hypothetical protein PL11201_720004 [Planktothrix sp. PCC 11201]
MLKNYSMTNRSPRTLKSNVNNPSLNSVQVPWGSGGNGMKNCDVSGLSYAKCLVKRENRKHLSSIKVNGLTEELRPHIKNH